MKRTTIQTIVILGLILASSPWAGATNLRIQQGRPVVDGVFVNGHGPYTFLVDTGTNVNLIETDLARSIGLEPTSEVNLASAAGATALPQIEGVEISLDSAKAGGQTMLFSGLEAVHHLSPNIQCVLGQFFLSQFDYLLDLRGKQLEFGKRDWKGTRVPFEWNNGRPALFSSMGQLILDSGSAQLTLFGVEPDHKTAYLNTVSGRQQVGTVDVEHLNIGGHIFWRGDAIAIPHPPQAEAGLAGLLPLNVFKSVYVCNSEGYVILD